MKFYKGQKIRFRDGEILEVYGNAKVRKNYFILLKSIATGKRYTEYRLDLIRCIQMNMATFV